MERTRRFLKRAAVGGFFVFIGLLVGELTSPNAAQAAGCSHSTCFVGAGGSSCYTSIERNNCVFGGGGCQTQECPPE